MENYFKNRIAELQRLENHYLDAANKLEEEDDYKLHKETIFGLNEIGVKYQIRRRELQTAEKYYLKNK